MYSVTHIIIHYLNHYQLLSSTALLASSVREVPFTLRRVDPAIPRQNDWSLRNCSLGQKEVHCTFWTSSFPQASPVQTWARLLASHSQSGLPTLLQHNLLSTPTSSAPLYFLPAHVHFQQAAQVLQLEVYCPQRHSRHPYAGPPSHLRYG